jgi:hypothetical protein
MKASLYQLLSRPLFAWAVSRMKVDTIDKCYSGFYTSPTASKNGEANKSLESPQLVPMRLLVPLKLDFGKVSGDERLVSPSLWFSERGSVEVDVDMETSWVKSADEKMQGKYWSYCTWLWILGMHSVGSQTLQTLQEFISVET